MIRHDGAYCFHYGYQRQHAQRLQNTHGALMDGSRQMLDFVTQAISLLRIKLRLKPTADL